MCTDWAEFSLIQTPRCRQSHLRYSSRRHWHQPQSRPTNTLKVMQMSQKGLGNQVGMIPSRQQESLCSRLDQRSDMP